MADKIGKVLIVESLRPNDYETGKDLFAEIQKNSACPREYRKVQNKNELFSLLQKTAINLSADSLLILGLEVHGDATGIQLASGEVIEWEELAAELAPINRTNGNKLVVVSAACCGGNLCWRLAQLKECPFFAIFGPEHPINEHDLLQFTKESLKKLLSGLSVQDLVREIRAAGPAKPWIAIDSLSLFKEVLTNIFMQEFGPGRDENIERIKDGLKKLKVCLSDPQEYLMAQHTNNTGRFPSFESLLKDWATANTN